jgi:hypothetical protein
LLFPIPDNEPQRLGALRALEILDTAPEIAYDEIAELAAQICSCPVAYISFIDDDRRWLKAKYGLPLDMIEAPREAAVCSPASEPKFLAHLRKRRVHALIFSGIYRTETDKQRNPFLPG